MSVQYGRWNFVGQSLAPDYIEKVSAAIAPYGPDSNELYSKNGIEILYRAFHTTKESHREKQPYISPSEAVITWDGRLDNRTELINELRDSATLDSTDVAIIGAAYEKWGTNCLEKLIGDWAVSIWNPRDRSLVLARDFLGARNLYYTIDENQVTWSTLLDPLVLFSRKPFPVCEEYVASWLATAFPAIHLTPYVGIHSVLPSSFVLLRAGRVSVSKYWDFDGARKIRYRSDGEYEEHFRSVFAQGVQQRLRSDRPVLAELSGGMDSASIVCMADLAFGRGKAECPRLDTISWYDDSYDHIEPDTNELHWITKVEEKRGRVGYHINSGEIRLREINSPNRLGSEFENDCFAASPTLTARRTEHFKQYAEYLRSRGLRVTLSGLGGEMATGGNIPTPAPELRNLLARGRFLMLGRRLKTWALKMRRPQLLLLWEAIRAFVPLSLIRGFPPAHPASWLQPAFARRNSAALCHHPSRIKLLGPLPSFQDLLEALKGERKLMTYIAPQPKLMYEIRLPYLDRSLLEFMYSIPWEQIVRAGQRRSLMKRALIGILPNELLTRRRKTFVPQKSEERILTDWRRFAEVGQHMVSSSLGFTDSNRLFEALQTVQSSGDVVCEGLKRTLVLEFWLRHLITHGVLRNPRTIAAKK